MEEIPRERPAQPVAPRPAAATTLLRSKAGGGVEVFMVRRHVQSEFVPDVFVFPGGSVQESDREVERIADLCAPVGEGPTTLGSGFRAAALRELFEEAGVLIGRQGGRPLAIAADAVPRFAEYRAELNRKTGSLTELAQREGVRFATDELIHWAHWITPEAWPKRFDTHFFLAEMPSGQEAAHDALETTAGVWVTPEAALEGFEQGDFPLVFATIHQLRALAGIDSVAAARERFRKTTPRTIMPRVAQRDGADVILLPDEQ